ncbi:TPR repeat protein [Fulvivirga imtechensis AK7]|uniref:TPR repeat protein n=1 Tax=Fulvivirga imtechensis AK7 TaxID=1237149 RepID=L8JTV0_9BACT|nr:TPR repeat protein [Fulvivirga imtechensis AK7]
MSQTVLVKRLLLLLFSCFLYISSLAQSSIEKLFNRGYHYISVDREQAINYLTQCIEKDSTFTKAFFHRGICFFKNGDYNNALEDFKTAYRLNPENNVIWMYQGFTYRNMGQMEKALSSFSNYISLHPQDTSAYSYILRGKMKYELGDFTGAVEDYDMALRLKPFEEKYEYYRFVALYNSEKYPQALKAANRLTRINPDFYGYYFYKGNVFSKMNQPDSAIFMYNIAIIKNYNNSDSYFYRAQAYQQKREYTKALEDYATAIMLNNDDGSYYSMRGNCRYEMNDKAGACADWEEAGGLGYYEDFDKVKKVCE